MADIKDLKPSNDQEIVLLKLLDWAQRAKPGQYVTVGGYAGTGKTTLLSIFRRRLYGIKKNRIAFCSYTGKAALVLERKLNENKALYSTDFVGTIHSLIYSPLVNMNEEIVGWDLKDEIDYDLIIIDEASMVDEQIWKDLLSYQIPIIAVGDHGQLPPINGKFNLMAKPHLKLEQIHRQAKDNPIINLSVEAREKGTVRHGTHGEGVIKFPKNNADSQDRVTDILQGFDQDTLILCGYNNTRVKLNKFIRQNLLFESSKPITGDRVICLRNNRAENIYNGMLGTIEQIEEPKDDPDWYWAQIKMDDRSKPFKGLIYKSQFNNPQSLNYTKDRKSVMKGDLFDFGYAITVHKAQGSQAKKVVLFEERFKQMDEQKWRQWLYTGVTRAEEELYIIG